MQRTFVPVLVCLALYAQLAYTLMDPTPNSSSPVVNKENKEKAARQKNSKDLKKLIQELEESDYSNFGSWGNFQSRKTQQQQQQQQQESQPSPQKETGGSKELDELDLAEGTYSISDYSNPDFEEPYWLQQNQQQYQQAQGVFPPPPPLPSGNLHNAVSTSSDFELLERWRSLARDGESLMNLDPDKLIRFGSIMKITCVVVFITVLSYISVVPKHLELAAYNSSYKDNLLRVFASIAWPVMLLAITFRSEDANINQVVSLFVFSFFIGYPLLCIVEVTIATAVRLAVLKITEPKAFSFCPKVPGLYLPWVLHNEGYFPSRITLLLFSILNSCIVAPLVEEVFKLKLLQSSLKSTRSLTFPTPSQNSLYAEAETKKKRFASTTPVTTRSYVVYMTAICLGLKVADNTRRILLYTAPHHKHKNFFAIARGLFPLQELCGAMTALALARRNLLSQASWDVVSVGPAVVLHAMANFRGMKPLYVWGSKRPWDELQLQAWNAADDATPQQLLIVGILNLLWFMVLVRTLTHIVQSYIEITRSLIVKLRAAAAANKPSATRPIL